MVNCTLTDEELRPKIVIDVPMPVSYIHKRTGRTDFASGTLWKREYKTGLCAEKSQSA